MPKKIYQEVACGTDKCLNTAKKTTDSNIHFCKKCKHRTMARERLETKKIRMAPEFEFDLKYYFKNPQNANFKHLCNSIQRLWYDYKSKKEQLDKENPPTCYIPITVDNIPKVPHNMTTLTIYYLRTLVIAYTHRINLRLCLEQMKTHILNVDDEINYNKMIMSDFEFKKMVYFLDEISHKSKYTHIFDELKYDEKPHVMKTGCGLSRLILNMDPSPLKYVYDRVIKDTLLSIIDDLLKLDLSKFDSYPLKQIPPSDP